MLRKTRVLLGVLTLAVAGITPAVGALAEQGGADVGLGSGDGASASVAVERSEYGSYVVVMAADPLVVSHGTGADAAVALRSDAARAAADAMVASHDAVLAASGVDVAKKVHDYTNALNGFSARLSHAEAVAVAARPDVALVLPDELYQLDTDASPRFLGLTGRGGAWSQGLTGEGVVVGVIDTGIWPEHPSFADDGSYAPPPAKAAGVPCEFGNVAHNNLDFPFECNDKLIGARQVLDTYRDVIGAEVDEFDSARDDDGHGTHTASTAAGNQGVQARIAGRPVGVGPISGIAPRAHVIAYKGLGNLGGFGSDLAAAIDLAVADGVDVINYSVGGGGGTIRPDDLSFLFAAAAGVHVATSAGNSGPGPVTIGGPAHVPWLTTVGANTQRREFEGIVHLGNGDHYEGVSIMPPTDQAYPLVDAADAGDELCNPGELDPTVVTGNIVLCKRGAIARVAKSQAVLQAGGVGMVLYNETDAQALFSDTHFVPAVHVNLTNGLAIKDYIAAADSPTAALDSQLGRDPAAPYMADFSSRGENPLADDVIKPDITAPGVQILAGYSPFPGPAQVPGQLFAAIAGTSMSSPHIAGVMALLDQAHPGWSPAAVKSAMMTTADTDVLDEGRQDQASPFAMGSGMVDPGKPQHPGSAFRPGLVYDAGYLDYLGFLCGTAPEVFTDAATTCGQLQAAGYATDASDLNYPSIGVGALAGTQTVTRTVTQTAPGTRTWRAHVDAPAGYDVTVTPDRLRLSRGQEGTFEVTITNDGSAAIDEFAFGWLHWSSGGYEATSPIGIRGTLLAAPPEVDGTGEAGAVAFDIQFGYTGDYTAAAHGLVPETVTSDTVVQDPDQSFDPTDGFSNAHEFDLSGVAHWRLRMPPDATEDDADLDLFVVDPDGNLVAASTAGGTDEAIDITLPQDGTWTVFVHGWATPGGDSDYDLSSWAVPLATGGSLEILSAPDQAVSGETGRVEAAWEIDSEGQYLGAVSHSGPDGLLGLTLVAVDNG